MLGSVLDWVYPSKCGLCGRFGPEAICGLCTREFRELTSTAMPGTGPIETQGSLYQYEGRAGQAIRRLKFARSTALADSMAASLANAYERFGFEKPDAIVPVPIHWSRRAYRGFNQSELLCKDLPKELYAPELLRRARRTKPQIGLSAVQRGKNLAGAFKASPNVKEKRILLVDDVTTSGHTARECAQALLSAGASAVDLLTYCAEV